MYRTRHKHSIHLHSKKLNKVNCTEGSQEVFGRLLVKDIATVLLRIWFDLVNNRKMGPPEYRDKEETKK